MQKQTTDVELSRKIIKENIEKFKSVPNVQAYSEVITLIDSDKPFTSFVEIANEQLIKYLPQN